MLAAPGSALNRDFPSILIHGWAVVVPQCGAVPSRCKASGGQCALLTPVYILKEGIKAVGWNCLVANLISSRLSFYYHFSGSLQPFGAGMSSCQLPHGSRTAVGWCQGRTCISDDETKKGQSAFITFWVFRLPLTCFLLPSVVLSSHELRWNPHRRKGLHDLKTAGFGAWLVKGWRACWGSKPGPRLCCECLWSKTEVFPPLGSRWSVVPPNPDAGG